MIHIVKRGDTIWSIAQSYGISPEKIVSDNGLAGLEYLVEGQAILILIPDLVHTVREGDTLYSVARIYGVTTIELIQKNIILALNPVLYPGQVLTIKYEDESEKPIEIYGYAYPYIQDNVIFKSAPYLTSCAVFSYGFKDDGTLIPTDDDKILNILSRFSTKPVMVISSIDENGSFDSKKASMLFNNVQLQQKVIDSMNIVISEKGYRGVDIDFEYVDSADSEAFTEFVRRVADAMNSRGINVNVDLAPKSSDSQRGLLYEGHNYATLGNAANTVLLMTYEWGYTYGPPMAVSPLNQVRKVVEFGVSQIENSKIYMGIPNYGYDWKLPYEKGVTKATSIGNEQALKIASEFGVRIEFDSVSQSPYFEYSDSAGAEHIVWFEDVRSISAKFDIIDEFSLRGAGYWNLMRPFTQNWVYAGYRYNIIKTAE